MNNIPEIYKLAIKAKYPNAQNLRTPVVCGSQQNVIFADIDNKTIVFKFGTEDIIKKNVAISKTYLDFGIPVPRIKMKQYNNLFFEEYEQLAGKTLYEAINEGMPADKIKKVYRQILKNIAKMCKITPDALKNKPNKNIHLVAREHVTNVNNVILGNICMALIYIVNLGTKKDTAVFHSDITPKNTIVSNDGILVGFVDLDSVAIANLNYIFSAMAAKYQQMGFDISELCDYFEKISNIKLNRTRISTIANANSFAKKMLWKHSQSKQQ